MSDAIHLTQAQQLLLSFAGMGLGGSALFALRSVPKLIWGAVREAASVCLLIDSDDEAYRHVSVWLARHRSARRGRRLMLAEAYDYDRSEWNWEITLGQGWHLVMFGAAPVLIYRHVQEPDSLGRAVGASRRERLTLMTPGRRQEPIRRLIAEAKDAYQGVGMVQIYFWTAGYYQVADRRRARSIDTVFMPEVQKDRLVADIETFVASREAYHRRGVPWRRGYLFEGPPGTGKTTLIGVMAGHIGRSLYVLNLNSLAGDNELITAVNAVARDGVLVIEDIDGVKVSHDRDAPAAQLKIAGGTALQLQPEQDRRGITLSGLLNAIDGVTARDGRILFITSNKPDHLDAALLRAGRVDVREHIALLGRDEAWAMVRSFHPAATETAFIRDVVPKLPISAATLQNLLIAEWSA